MVRRFDLLKTLKRQLNWALANNPFEPGTMNSTPARLRVLFVPDSVHWVTGTIAKAIARFNPWIEATIASGPVIDSVFADHPELMRNFDLVHFTCPYASREWLPRFREIVPCVTSHHHVSDWDLLKHNLDGDAIIVGSPEWSQDLELRGGDLAKVFCVPYGVHAGEFKPASDGERAAIRKGLGISPNAITVGFFGKNSSNEHDRKGIDVFSAALRSLHRKLPEMVAVVVGPGWQELVASLESEGIHCRWFPFIRDQDELSKMYRALDFYWVTARVEGGPVTLLEAMSSEVCCLTTAVGLAREIVVDGKNAVLLPFNDAEAFAARTAVLAADSAERRRLGRNARQTILERMHVGLTVKAVAKVYAKAFENFAARQPGPLFDENLPESYTADGSPSGATQDDVPLGGFPDSIHGQVKMLESLAFAETLIRYHQQRVVGFKMISRAWLRNPASSLPVRILLRSLLPGKLVERLVRLKNRSRRSPELLPH